MQDRGTARALTPTLVTPTIATAVDMAQSVGDMDVATLGAALAVADGVRQVLEEEAEAAHTRWVAAITDGALPEDLRWWAATAAWNVAMGAAVGAEKVAAAIAALRTRCPQLEPPVTRLPCRRCGEEEPTRPPLCASCHADMAGEPFEDER